MSGKRKVILTLSAAVLAAAVLLTALFFFVLRPRMDERVFMDGRPLSRQELLAYTSPYDQAVDPLCKPYLEDEPRLLYAAFLYAYEQRASTIRLRMEEAYSKEAVFEILSMLKADYPQFMTTTLESQFTLEQDEKGWLTVGIPAAELAYIPDETALASIESLLAEIPGVPAGQLSPAAARAYSIYTYLTANISYQAEGEADGIGWNFTVQGAIRDGKAQCNGIAGVFQLLCNLEDIPCYKVFYRGRDVGRDYGHVWNVVQLDGQWYHVDITAAVQFRQTQEAYFAEEEMSPEILIPDFFGMSDEAALSGTLRYTGVLEDKVPTCPEPLGTRDSLYGCLALPDGDGGYQSAAAKAGAVLAVRKEDAYPAVSIRFGDADELSVFQQNLFTGKLYIAPLMDGLPYAAQIHIFRNQSTLYLYLSPSR